MKMLKLFVRSSVVCWLRLVRSFILESYSYNFTSWWWNLFLVFWHFFFFHLSLFLVSLSSFWPKVKAVNLLVCFSVILDRKGLCQSGCRILKSNISLGQSDQITCFFAYWYQKLRIYRKILRWVWSKMGCGHPNHRDFKLAIYHKKINGVNWFFEWWYKFRIAKNYLMDMVEIVVMIL